MVAPKFGSLTIYFTMAKYKSKFKPKSGFFVLTASKSLSSDFTKTSMHKEGVPHQVSIKESACFMILIVCLYSISRPYQVRTKAA